MEITKPRINIGLLGQDGHGKSTLAAAIFTHLSHKNEQVEEGFEITISIGSCREVPELPYVYETDRRRYSICDFESSIDVAKSFMLNRIQLDGCILVVSAADGVTAQTLQHVRLARASGIAAIAVFMNKCDLADDAELLDLVEVEVRELLTAYGYSADTQVIRGSAGVVMHRQTLSDSVMWNSRIGELLNAVDAAIPNPIDINSLPFLMQIDDMFSITGRGTVAVGTVERGTYRDSMPVDIVGLGSTRSTIASELDTFGWGRPVTCAGSDAGLLLRGLSRTDVQRGQVLAAPATVQPYARFRAELYLCTRQEGGRERYVLSGTTNLFRIRTAEVNGTVKLGGLSKPLRGGDTVEVMAELEAPVALEAGVRFSLLLSGKSVAFGIVTEVLI